MKIKDLKTQLRKDEELCLRNESKGIGVELRKVVNGTSVKGARVFINEQELEDEDISPELFDALNLLRRVSEDK